MIPKIIAQFGKVRHAYLIGPLYDIYKVYLFFEEKNFYRIELKHPFYMSPTSEHEVISQSEIEQLSPENAYIRLANCNYEDPKARWSVARPNKNTVKAVMNLLIASV